MIRIVGDTTSCLSPAEAQSLGVAYIPQIIVFGEQSYRDDTEMNSIEFMRRLRVSTTLPKTAAPPPDLYTPIYKQLVEQGDTVVVLAPAAEVSGTFRSATVAAQDFPGAPIYVIDTRIIAGGFGELIKQAVEWANAGMALPELLEKVNEMAARHRVYFVVATLEYLYKGGRIGAAKALFGSILQVKPILTFIDGHIAPCESQRTHRRAIARLKEIVLSECPHGPQARLTVMHGDAEEEAHALAGELCEQIGCPQTTVPIYDLPPAILVHAGPGVLAVSYYVE
jgi:DegV family protein with EDD domain